MAGGRDEIRAGFDLTGAFLRASVFAPRGEGLPPERARFIDLALRERSLAAVAETAT